MTIKLEEQFFKVFGIEPKIKDGCKYAVIIETSDLSDWEQYLERKKKKKKLNFKR